MVIGLLGGIGSGKSTVASLLARQGATWVDADRLGHDVLRTAGARRKITERFGSEVIGTDGDVDRKALARRVFSDPAALSDLNAIVHPPVRKTIREEISRHRKREEARGERAILVLDIPLLDDSLRTVCDALVFVEIDPEVRRARLKARNLTPEEVERREAFQIPLEEKRALAGFSVDNSGSLEDTRAALVQLVAEIQDSLKA